MDEGREKKTSESYRTYVEIYRGQREGSEWLVKMVEALPELEAQAVTLVYLDGLTMREAALVMNCGAASVYRYASAGLKRLREEMGVER